MNDLEMIKSICGDNKKREAEPVVSQVEEKVEEPIVPPKSNKEEKSQT